jgi:hypothetical protein
MVAFGQSCRRCGHVLAARFDPTPTCGQKRWCSAARWAGLWAGPAASGQLERVGRPQDQPRQPRLCGFQGRSWRPKYVGSMTYILRGVSANAGSSWNCAGTLKMSKGLPATPRQAGATPEAAESGRKTAEARANVRALAHGPIIAEIQADGLTTPHAIAAALTDRGVPTALGHRFWTSNQVRRVLDRLARLAPLNSAGAQSLTSPRPKRNEKPISATSLSNTAVITFSKRRRRGRPTASEIVGRILTQMRTEGSSLLEPHPLLAKMVAARNNRALGDRSWHETTIVKHIRQWLRENPDPNDYRVALTLKEAARKSGLKRALLDIAISRGALRAHKCGARTLILQSDLCNSVFGDPRRARHRRR